MMNANAFPEKRINTFWRSTRLFLISLLANIVFLLIAYTIFRPYYNGNDDYTMMTIASGQFTGTPDGHLVFIKYAIGFLISSLYQAFPAVSWYVVVMYGTIVFSMSIIAYRTISLCRRIWQGALGVALCILFYFLVFFRYLIFLNFTITAGLPAIAAIFWYYTQRTERSRRQFVWDTIVCSFLAFLSICIRTDVFYMLLPIAAAVLIFRHFAGVSRIEKYRSCIFAGVLVAILASVLCIEKVAYSSPEYKQYMEFNNARSAVFDYGRMPDYNTSEGKEFYSKHDIGKELYTCIRNNCLKIDGRISTALLTAMENTSTRKISLSKTIYNVLDNFMEVFIKNRYDIIMTFITAVTLIIAIFLALRKHDAKPASIILISILAALAECFYLAFVGRLIERVVVPLLGGLAFVGFAAIWQTLCDGRLHFPALLRQSVALTVAAAATLVVAIMIICSNELINTHVDYISYQGMHRQEFIEYCQQHKDKNYYYSVQSFYNAVYKVNLFDRAETRNYVSEGGWLTDSPMQNDNIKMNGLSRMDQDLLKGNVFYLSVNSPQFLVNYYQFEGIPVDVEQVDYIADAQIGVYKFAIRN